MKILPRLKTALKLLYVQQTAIEAAVCEGSVRLVEGERAMLANQAGSQAERASSSHPSKEAGRESGERQARLPDGKI